MSKEESGRGMICAGRVGTERICAGRPNAKTGGFSENGVAGTAGGDLGAVEDLLTQQRPWQPQQDFFGVAAAALLLASPCVKTSNALKRMATNAFKSLSLFRNQ